MKYSYKIDIQEIFKQKNTYTVNIHIENEYTGNKSTENKYIRNSNTEYT